MLKEPKKLLKMLLKKNLNQKKSHMTSQSDSTANAIPTVKWTNAKTTKASANHSGNSSGALTRTNPSVWITLSKTAAPKKVNALLANSTVA